MPVVKLLGGDSVVQVCTTAARMVMASRISKEGGRKERDQPSSPPSPPPLPPFDPSSVSTVVLGLSRTTTTTTAGDFMSGSQTPGVFSSDNEATSVPKNDGNNASSTSSDDGEKWQQYKLETSLLHPASKLKSSAKNACPVPKPGSGSSAGISPTRPPTIWVFTTASPGL